MFLVSRKAIQKSLSVGMLMLLVSVSARAQYTIKNVGSLEVGKSSAANAVNNHGQVVGVSDTSDGWRAFMYSGSSMLNLGALAGGTDASGRLFKFSTANSINDSGEAVGESITPQGQRPTLYSQGKVASLGTLDNGFNTYANDINSHGQIVGWAATYAGTRAFLYEGSGMQNIGSLAGFGNTSAYAIDDIGQVVGSSETARGQRAFLYYQGDMINLGTLPGGSGSGAFGMNDRNQVVGWSDSSEGTRAFLYSNGAMRSLGTLESGGISVANSVNNEGQVVGWASTSTGSRPFLYSKGNMFDLFELVDNKSGWLNFQDARGINDAGQIVGVGNFNGVQQAFLLTLTTPVPEQASAWLMMLGLAGLFGYAGCRGRKKSSNVAAGN